MRLISLTALIVVVAQVLSAADEVSPPQAPVQTVMRYHLKGGGTWVGIYDDKTETMNLIEEKTNESVGSTALARDQIISSVPLHPNSRNATEQQPKGPVKRIEDLVPTAEVPPSFRGFPWGTPIETIKEKETDKKISESKDKILEYKSFLAATNLKTEYWFNADGLYKGEYVSMDTHVENQQYLDDYDRVKALLVEKYGRPTEDQHLWANDLFKNDPKQWGTAVAAEQLSIIAIWKGKGTTITEALAGDHFKILLIVEYSKDDAEIKNQKDRNEHDKAKM